MITSWCLLLVFLGSDVAAVMEAGVEEQEEMGMNLVMILLSLLGEDLGFWVCFWMDGDWGLLQSTICFQGSNGRVGGCHCLCSWRHGLPPFAFEGLRSTERTGEEEDKGWSEKKMVEVEFLKLEFYVNFFPHQMTPLPNRNLETQLEF